jgi:hypothetical protein
VGKPEGNRPFGRPRHSWEDCINIDLQEAGCMGKDWIDVARDRERWRAVLNVVINLKFS